MSRHCDLVLSLLFLSLLLLAQFSAAAASRSYHLFKLLHNLNKTLDEVVDATPAQMDRVFHHGNICPFKHKVFDKLVKGQDINIFIVGGSVTAGSELPDRQLRWSTSFTNNLKSGWYNGSIDVENLGVGGRLVDIWMTRINDLRGADMVIVDLSVNDQTFEPQVLPHLYKTFIQLLNQLPNHPAVMFHLSYRISLRDAGPDATKTCSAASETVTCCDGIVICRRWWLMSEYVASVLREYEVPYISYKQLTWPVLDSPPAHLEDFWHGNSHPDARAHALMGKLISFGFYKSIKRAEEVANHCELEALNEDNPELAYRYKRLNQSDESVGALCSTPLTQMMGSDTADSATSFDVVYVGRNWRFYSDSKNKFGYILNASQCSLPACDNYEDNRLSLRVKLGQQPIVQVYYLKTFTADMGAVNVFVDESYRLNSTVSINGKWSHKSNGFVEDSSSSQVLLPFSVTRVATMSKTNLTGYDEFVLGDHSVLPELSAGEHIVHFLPSNATVSSLIQPMKFKLLGLTSC